MREHPILFTGEMVRAILNGIKTQTRRVIKPQSEGLRCKYDVGDRLWVRETWCYKMTDGRYEYDANGNPSVYYRATDPDVEAVDDDGMTKYRKDRSTASPWIPSIFMPYWASRIFLEITILRVERLQEISPWSIEAEGITSYVVNPLLRSADLKEQWVKLWNSINAKRGYGWDVNPKVMVITFKMIKGGAASE